MSRLPKFLKRKICIICEGNEEYDYIERLKLLNVWNEIYDVKCINAEGNGNVPARYQNEYQGDSYEYIFVFCDTDKKPYEQYNEIKEKIDLFHGIEGVSKNIVIFGNPCTLQIICLHWNELKLKSNAKKRNADIIKEYTEIENYKAKKEQREILFKSINADNYKLLKERLLALSEHDNDKNSSNFGLLIQCLENSDAGWIDDFNSILNETEE